MEDKPIMQPTWEPWDRCDICESRFVWDDYYGHYVCEEGHLNEPDNS